MRIRVNGEPRDAADGSTVADLMTTVGAPDRGVAVAVDGAVVRRASWETTTVPDGADIEIVTAVQGG